MTRSSCSRCGPMWKPWTCSCGAVHCANDVNEKAVFQRGSKRYCCITSFARAIND